MTRGAASLRVLSRTLLLTGSLAAFAPHAQEIPVSARRLEEYDANVRKSIVELQPFRTTASATLPDGRTVTLVSINPRINAWFLLTIGDRTYHLENPRPGREVALHPGSRPVLEIGADASCAPWEGDPSALAAAQKGDLPFAPLCEGRLYLRNKVAGARTSLESVTGFLRDHVWGGERIVRLVKDNFFRDRFAATSDLEPGGHASATAGPRPARVSDAYADRRMDVPGFGIALAGPDARQMAPGMWYAAAGIDGVFASAMQPRAISPEILRGPGRTNPLDGTEASALVYSVAFDLSRYRLGFALGTDHPRLGWSPRPPASVRPRGLPGPDGIDRAAPLVTTGMVPPAFASGTVAAFAGGFKREHGAFKYGALAQVNRGSHYGFIEEGAIFSKLQPSLATLFVLDDGSVSMKTWEDSDNQLLRRIRFARQNGVPLLETDPDTGLGVPGPLVTSWGGGNWSGSADMQLRTLRAGACLQERDGRTFLIYSYFSTATPSAMARTFQAYGCRYAMLLDMNALEHTYLALYVRSEDALYVEHLVTGMSVLDKTARGGGLVPRFLGFPDNRDLFFIYTPEETP